MNIEGGLQYYIVSAIFLSKKSKWKGQDFKSSRFFYSEKCNIIVVCNSAKVWVSFTEYTIIDKKFFDGFYDLAKR